MKDQKAQTNTPTAVRHLTDEEIIEAVYERAGGLRERPRLKLAIRLAKKSVFDDIDKFCLCTECVIDGREQEEVYKELKKKHGVE